jgi:hypothetical protein
MSRSRTEERRVDKDSPGGLLGGGPTKDPPRGSNRPPSPTIMFCRKFVDVGLLGGGDSEVYRARPKATHPTRPCFWNCRVASGIIADETLIAEIAVKGGIP